MAHVMCCSIISVCFSRVSTDSFYDTFHTTADMMYFCQMMAVIEVVNPLLGLVKTGFFPAVIQVIHGSQSLLIIIVILFSSTLKMKTH